MGRLAGFKYREVARKLRSLGFEFDRPGPGSHEVWRHSITGRKVTVPHHARDMAEGRGHTRSHPEHGIEAMDQLLHDKREEISKIALSHGAMDIRLFGSRARGEAEAASDVDLLVKLAPGRTLLDLVAIKQDLEDLLGCPVDVLTEEAISPYIRPQVLRQAITLRSATPSISVI